MRVLIVSQYFWPEAFRINEVAQSLREVGCEVVVLTGQPNYPDGVVFPGYKASSTGIEEHEGLTIHRVPMAPRGAANARRLVINYLSFMLSGALFGPWRLRQERFDVVFVYGASPILKIFPAWVVHLFTGGVLVTWVQDIWPQSLEVTGFVRNRLQLATVGWIVGWLYRRNDLLLVQSHGFVPLVRALAGCTPVEYHPNPGELAFLSQTKDVAALTLDPGFNVVFAGNLGTVQALDTVLAAAVMLEDIPQVRFVLIGSGSRWNWLRSEIERLGLNNVQLPGRFPVRAMPALLAQASALLVSLTRDPVLSQTVPSKVQAYLASGRPLIASLDGEGARIVREAGAGLVCPAEDAGALAQAVRELAAMSAEERERLGVAGRRYYLENFEPNHLAVSLKCRFASLIEQKAGRETQPK